uniref:Uncharacterized protein n=1 Tax=Anguilla anguilla TaxID=7936 RepID=A0A0E9S026_ANGAN
MNASMESTQIMDMFEKSKVVKICAPMVR